MRHEAYAQSFYRNQFRLWISFSEVILSSRAGYQILRDLAEFNNCMSALVKVLVFLYEMQKCFTAGTDDKGLVIEEGLLSKADTQLKNLVGQASASVSHQVLP